MANSTPRSAVARDLGDGFYGVWCAFEHKDAVKALPGARWDKHLKCWRIPGHFAEDVAQLIADLNDEQVRRRTWREHDDHGTTSVPAALSALFVAIPDAMRRPTHRALAKAWHPDRGGDVRLMQHLNALELGGAK